MKMKLGQNLYQVPALQQTMNCTDCGRPIPDVSVGTADEAIIAVNSKMLGNPPDTKTDRCPKCGRVFTEDKNGTDTSEN